MSIPDIFRAAVVWVFSILLYLHILAAIFWFGSGLMLQLVFIPSLAGMTFDAQHAWLQALTRRYSRVIGAVGGLTVLLGIVRGTRPEFLVRSTRRTASRISSRSSSPCH